MSFSKDNFGFKTDSNSREGGKAKKVYRIWYNMISRCYNKSSSSYKTYGAKGVTICDDWKSFKNFEDWYNSNIPKDGQEYHIDKDINSKDDVKIYSPETCIFISPYENRRESALRKDYTYLRGENNPFYGKTGESAPNCKTKEYYETVSIRRRTFKNGCLKKGWNFEDFTEVDSGEREKDGYTKKFFYFYKK